MLRDGTRTVVTAIRRDAATTGDVSPRVVALRRPTADDVLITTAHELHEGPAQYLAGALWLLDAGAPAGATAVTDPRAVGQAAVLARSALGALRETGHLLTTASALYERPAEHLAAAVRLLELSGARAGRHGARRRRVQHALRVTRAALVSVRETIQALTAMPRTPGNLRERLRALAAEVEPAAGLRLRLRIDDAVDDADLPFALAWRLDAIAREAVRNAAKHGRARRVSIAVSARRHAVRMTIADNGRGLRPREGTRRGSAGVGLMKRCAQSVGGTLTIAGRAGGGVRVTATIPAALTDGVQGPFRPAVMGLRAQTRYGA